MALFQPRVFQEILPAMVSRLVATTPLTDLNVGGVFTTMLEAAAQEDDEQYFQMLEIIRGYSLDTTTGADLDARAFEYSITRLGAQLASTVVTLGDTAVTKIVTNVYSGLPGSAAGTMSINGNALTGFPTSGSLVVGRGTPRAETVPFTSITNNGTYVTFNLSAGFTYDHGTDETLILSQGGNRIINAGSVVKVPASDINPEINYSLVNSATILDGERIVTDVAVVAQSAGSQSNVPIGSIIQYDSLPFSTAFVTNPERVTNGRDLETDQALRDRIKSTIQSLSRGTGRSIITGVQGVISNNRRVVSASLVEPTIPADVVKVFIDDGTGFIPTFEHVGAEIVVQQATGGEKFLSALNVPLVKAFVETQNVAPWNLVGGESLFVEVGGQVEVITFSSLDFTVGAATAQQVLKKINTTADLFECRVTRDGSQIKIFARANTDEQIQVTGGSANLVLNFPTDLKETMKLYRIRDGIATLLTKDGITAAIDCTKPAAYDMSLMQNLVVVVDGKDTSPQMIWFSPDDFVSPANVTTGQIVTLINAKLSGAVAQSTSNDTLLRITSNTKRSAISALQVADRFTKVWHFDGGTYNDRTSSALTGATLSNVGTDYLYLGHETIPFESIYVNGISGPGNGIFSYWDGTVWQDFVPSMDETAGLGLDGHVVFKLFQPLWLKATVNGYNGFFIRVRSLGSTSGQVRICSANKTFSFPSSAAVVGADRDYTLNRFIGQIELDSTLNPLDRVEIGSFSTRASVVSSQGSYGLVGGEVLNLEIDGIAQVVTFQLSDFFAPGAAVPTEVVARINKDLTGATAEEVAAGTKFKLTVNKFNGGTLKITGGSANAFFQFPTTLQNSYIAHVPSMESASEDFSFMPDDSIIVVMDGNAANNFTTPCTKAGTLTSAASTTSMADTTLYNTFALAGDITGFDFLYTMKYYSTIQNIRYKSEDTNRKLVNISYTGGGTAGAEIVTVVGFSVTIKIDSGVSTANQIKAAFDAAPLATAFASCVISGSGAAVQVSQGQTYLQAPRAVINSYAVPTGAITLATALPEAPAIGDTYQVAPKTAEAVVAFWTNKKIALLTTQAEIRTSSGGTKVQIASLQAGEPASIQVPGGGGNLQLQFSTAVLVGIDGYRYFTGLAQVTQWTIDGRESDPDNYPGIRAAGVQVEVAEPVTVTVNVSLTITTQEGITLSSISNDVKSAVASYINSLTVGADVIVSEIIATVKDVSGVFDVQINAPTSNISVAFNELARLRESDVIVG